jgi:hypothetical protein
MAVSKGTIKTQLMSLYASAQGGMTDDAFADEMAGIIQKAILSATVTVTGVTPGSGSAGGTLT